VTIARFIARTASSRNSPKKESSLPTHLMHQISSRCSMSYCSDC
jgi:hypothetical protein